MAAMAADKEAARGVVPVLGLAAVASPVTKRARKRRPAESLPCRPVRPELTVASLAQPRASIVLSAPSYGGVDGSQTARPRDSADAVPAVRPQRGGIASDAGADDGAAAIRGAGAAGFAGGLLGRWGKRSRRAPPYPRSRLCAARSGINTSPAQQLTPARPSSIGRSTPQRRCFARSLRQQAVGTCMYAAMRQ